MSADARAKATAAFRAAVTSIQQNLLVIAPPGCGKTELLAQRAACLIDDLEPNQKILALTYSNKAKANLSARLTEVLGLERRRRYVTVKNFHGHAAEVLRAHGRTLGLDHEFVQPDKNQLPNALAEHVDGLHANAASELSSRIEADLRTAKQRPYSDEQVIEWLRSNGHQTSLEVEAARQVADTPYFDDLLRHAQRLIRVPQVAELYRRHYGAVLVDEFQDLSPQQLDIALRSCARSRTFVGDPLQGIYSWAGARPVRIERQLRRICGDPEGLGHSYRSSPNVLTLLNAVAAELNGPALESIDPDSWHQGGIATGIRLASGVKEGKFLVETAEKILERTPHATIGVISRAGWRRKPIDAAFESTELPVRRWDLALDNDHVLDLLHNSAAGLGDEFTADALLTEALSRIEASDTDTRADVIEAIEQLDVLTMQTGSLAAALGILREPGDPNTPISPGVHLLNAHVGKGQQFDWVFIPGFEDGHIPSFLAKSQAAILEELRILLVMISRARHGIVVTRATELISKAGKPYNPTASRWTASLRGGLSTSPQQLKDHIATLPDGQTSGGQVGGAP